MGELIAMFAILFVATPILVIAFNYRTIKNDKKSSALSKATVKNGNVTPEEMLKTLEDAGITINFLEEETK